MINNSIKVMVEIGNSIEKNASKYAFSCGVRWMLLPSSKGNLSKKPIHMTMITDAIMITKTTYRIESL